MPGHTTHFASILTECARRQTSGAIWLLMLSFDWCGCNVVLFLDAGLLRCVLLMWCFSCWYDRWRTHDPLRLHACHSRHTKHMPDLQFSTRGALEVGQAEVLFACQVVHSRRRANPCRTVLSQWKAAAGLARHERLHRAVQPLYFQVELVEPLPPSSFPAITVSG